MVTLLVLTSFVLWSFVFGWYPLRTGRPVVNDRFTSSDWVLTVVLGVGGAAAVAFIVDPQLRLLNPKDYPESIHAWTAGALFSITLSQLFLCYAPMAFFLRLLKIPALAILLTVLLGQFLLGLQLEAAALELDLPFKFTLFALRAAIGWAAATVFLRGGVVMGTTWCLIMEARLLVF